MAYTNKDFELWKRYELVRQSGQYNMITQFKEASKEAKMTIEEYTTILKKYSFIKSAIEDKFGSIENFLN